MAITSEQTLDIMIQQFKVWLELEDAWQVPEGVDVEVFNAVKAHNAMEHVYRNTEFAKVWYKQADRKKRAELEKYHKEAAAFDKMLGIGEKN